MRDESTHDTAVSQATAASHVLAATHDIPAPQDSAACHDTAPTGGGQIIELDLRVATESGESDAMLAFYAIEDRAYRADSAERCYLIWRTTRMLDSLHQMAGITPVRSAGRRRKLDAA